MNRKRKYLIILLTSIVVVCTVTLWANNTIIRVSKDFITDNIDKVSANKIGLLLGTSKYLRNGANNSFFFNRIDAAVELYKNGKIKYVIISGDNSKKDYNEPLDMKLELISRGVPDSVIYLDYAGFRTLDSILRAKEIFGQTSFIVISQKFHNERAVFIARKNGIEAFGYNAKDGFRSLKVKFREFFARDKVFLDMLFSVKPKFLGEKIIID